MMTRHTMTWCACLTLVALWGCEDAAVDTGLPDRNVSMPQPQPQPIPNSTPFIPPVITPNSTTGNNSTPDMPPDMPIGVDMPTTGIPLNPSGHAVGESCGADTDCRGYGICLLPPDAPNGYCITALCSTVGCEDERDTCLLLMDGANTADLCLKGCSTREDCRQGYDCLQLPGTQDFSCWVEGMGMMGNNTPGVGMDGSSCGSDADCAGGLCILDADGWPGGYCSRGCQNDVDCNGDLQGATCSEDPTTGGSLCLDRCEHNGECRTGYLCERAGLNAGVCKPDLAIAPGEDLQNLPFAMTCAAPDTDGLLFLDFTVSSGVSSYNLAFHGRFDTIASNEAEIPYIEIYGIERPSGTDLTSGTGPLGFLEDISLLVEGLPSLGVTVPTNPTKQVQLESGAHKAVIGTNADEVCFYHIEEFAPGDTLDLNIYLTGSMGLTAASAPSDPAFTQMMQTIQTRLSPLGISLGKVRLKDVSTGVATRYSAPTDSQLFELAQEITSLPGYELDDALSLNIIFVPQFNTSVPFLGLSLGINAPVGLHGTPMSATLASTEYLYQSGEDISGNPVEGGIYMGTTIVHELGHFMGLHHTSEAQFEDHDPLTDTPQCPSAQVSSPDYTSCPDVSNAMFPYISHPNPTFTSTQIGVLQANTLTKSATTEPSP